MSGEKILQLCDRIRETAFLLHNYLGHGHMEKIYENGLVHRLKKQGIAVVQQHLLTVFDEDGTTLGHFTADLFVESELIVELKACKTLVDEHVAQVLGYLRACKVRHGLLLNFGTAKIEIRKYVM
jgi:GxxExxY protein